EPFKKETPSGCRLPAAAVTASLKKEILKILRGISSLVSFQKSRQRKSMITVNNSNLKGCRIMGKYEHKREYFDEMDEIKSAMGKVIGIAISVHVITILYVTY